MNNKLLQFFRGIGLVLFLFIFALILYFVYCHRYELVIKLLIPLGVLISALIASYSVMVSIDNSNNIEENKKVQELHSRLDTSFYMLEKNKENIRLLEEYPKVDNPLVHKNSITNILEISLNNLNKLEKCEKVSPITVARIESYILAMKCIFEKSPEARGIKMPIEFSEQLSNFKNVTEETIRTLTKEYSS